MSYRTFHTQSALVNIMIKAAFKAAPRLVRDFGEVEKLQVSQKGPKDFVSNADRQAEAVIREELTKARPGFECIFEEGGHTEGTEPWTWVVDPLDGTLNFLHGFPHFAISIGVLKEGLPWAGIVYDPLQDELFWAEKGMGAFCYRHRLRVSRRALTDTLLVGINHPRLGRLTGKDSQNENFISLRHTGSSALNLSYVAAGRLDAFVSANALPWDIAAGVVLVQEAGGIVMDWSGKGLQDLEMPFVAHNGKIAKETFDFNQCQ